MSHILGAWALTAGIPPFLVTAKNARAFPEVLWNMVPVRKLELSVIHSLVYRCLYALSSLSCSLS